MQNAQENNPYILDNLEERIKEPLLLCIENQSIKNPKDLKCWIYFINNTKRIYDANSESDIEIIQSQINKSILIPEHIVKL